MANAVGGIIVLGFDTTRDPTTAGERISEVKQFPVGMVNPDQYRKIVHEYVHPPLDILVRVFEATDGKGVAAIVVERPRSKPYIVSKMVDGQGQILGVHFGFFERKQGRYTNAERGEDSAAAGRWPAMGVDRAAAPGRAPLPASGG